MQHLLKKWFSGGQAPVRPLPPDSSQLELISIHIPKTAGTSFRNILKEVYGDTGVVRLDIDLAEQTIRIDEQLYSQAELPAGTRVVHGHFSYPLFREKLHAPTDIPIITWLRDPVDRVISNYFYLEKRLREELDEQGKGLNILSKMQRSLLEYARFEPAQNRMSKFLTGLDLEDFFFVGIQEEYELSLQRLSGLLEWEDYPVYHHNKTGAARPKRVSEEERSFIRSLNQKDVALYERALNELAKGRWTP
jgi:hypothetical protein